MSLATFIPTVWAGKLLLNLHKAHVYAQDGVVNRDYEGEIADQGDSVKINAIGKPTIGTYSRDTNIGDPEALMSADATLLIDQAKFFNFAVDDVDRAQANLAGNILQTAMMEAGYALADVSDQFVAGLYTAAANLIGSDGSPKTPTVSAADAYGLVVQAYQKLSEANVPDVGRWIVVPPWFYALLLQDNRFINAQASGSTAALRQGDVGTILGMTVKTSNNVPMSSTHYKILAGYPGAITYAEQISKVEAYRPPQRFGDAVKGLHLYGGKVIRPSGLVVITADAP